MKTLIVLLAMTLIVGNLFGQTATLPDITGQQYTNVLITGEHTPVKWVFTSGTVAGDVLDSGRTVTTSWIQIGLASGASTVNNRAIVNYNPQYFTGILSLDTLQEDNANVPDSVGISQLLFELAFDTTSAAITALDSTHICIQDGGYNQALYGGNGGYIYEDIIGTLAQWHNKPVWFHMRVPFGGYMRFKLTHPAALSANLGVKFTLTIIAEH